MTISSRLNTYVSIGAIFGFSNGKMVKNKWLFGYGIEVKQSKQNAMTAKMRVIWFNFVVESGIFFSFFLCNIVSVQ